MELRRQPWILAGDTRRSAGFLGVLALVAMVLLSRRRPVGQPVPSPSPSPSGSITPAGIKPNGARDEPEVVDHDGSEQTVDARGKNGS